MEPTHVVGQRECQMLDDLREPVDFGSAAGPETLRPEAIVVALLIMGRHHER